MAKKKKRIYFFNYDVTELFLNFEELSKDPNNGIDFEKMLREIEAARGKENFQQIFRDIVSKNLEKVLTAQSKAIKNGTSNVKLSKMCAQFVDSMRTIEKICIDMKMLKGEALSPIFEEKKLIDLMKTIAKRELKSGAQNPALDAKLNKELDDIAKFKLDKDNTALRVQMPKKAFKRLLFPVAEKKFGSYGPNNKEQFDSYFKNFDFEKPEAEEDLKEAAKLTFITRNSLGFIIDPKTGLPYIYDLNFQKFLRTGEIYWFNGKSPASDAFRARYGFNDKPYFDYSFKKYTHFTLYEDVPPKKSESSFNAVSKLYNHFGFYLNTELLGEMLIDCTKQKEPAIFYRQAYMDTFIKLFEKTNCDYKNICQLLYDFEDVMQDLKSDIAPELYGEKFDFGGLKPKEMKNFLKTLTADECNITKKVKTELLNTCSKNGVVDVKEAVNFSKNQISNVQNKEDISDAEKLINSIASLTALQQIHNERASSFSFFHPFLYKEEQRAIDDLKDKIMELSNNTVPMDLQNSLNNGTDVYKEGYEQAIKDIDELSVNIERLPMENLGKNTSIENNKAPLGGKQAEPIKDVNKIVEIRVPGNNVLTKNKND